MKSGAKNSVQFSDSPGDADGRWHDERWVSGAFLVSEIFIRDLDRVDVAMIEEAIPAYFASIKQRKQALWPRGICGYFAIPIYCGDDFDGPTTQWVRNRPKYRYAMWHEPVLYRRDENWAVMNSGLGLGGIKFRPYLASRLMLAFQFLSSKYGHSTLPTVNGKQIA